MEGVLREAETERRLGYVRKRLCLGEVEPTSAKALRGKRLSLPELPSVVPAERRQVGQASRFQEEPQVCLGFPCIPKAWHRVDTQCRMGQWIVWMAARTVVH